MLFQDVKKSLENKPRTWYIKRWIPREICETIWEHCNRTKESCEYLVKWNPNRVEDIEWFPIMWFWHDIIEWDIPDITPSCGYTPEEKQELEKKSLQRLKNLLGTEYNFPLKKIEEYQLWVSHDSKELFYIDKALAGVWALEYERLWYKSMDDFHDYALEKISPSPYHTKIYKELLRKSFSNNSYFSQYNLLLELQWDVDKFREHITHL